MQSFRQQYPLPCSNLSKFLAGQAVFVRARLAFAAPIKNLEQISSAMGSRAHRWHEMLGRRDELCILS